MPKKKAAAKSTNAWTAEERAAMRDHVKEMKEDGGEAACLAAIAKLPEADRSMAKRLHALVKAAAPVLSPKTWYGMPAYALGKDGKVVCFYQSAQKFKTRYASFGFSDAARLDDGNLWPVAFALKQLTSDVEATISALVRRAVG